VYKYIRFVMIYYEWVA